MKHIQNTSICINMFFLGFKSIKKECVLNFFLISSVKKLSKSKLIIRNSKNGKLSGQFLRH